MRSATLRSAILRSASLAVLGGWLISAVALTGTVAWALTENRTHLVEATASAALTDDATGLPLFTSTAGLAPGHSRSSCLSISASNAGPNDEVTLLADHVTGALATDLRLDVYVGTGGSFGDCTGFSGTQMYDGTVDALATVGGDGVGSGWLPGSSSMRTFKFVLTLTGGPADQGRTAGARFVWRLQTSAPVIPPTATPTPTTTPTTTPSPTTSSDGPTTPGQPTGSPEPTGTPTGIATRTEPPTPGTPTGTHTSSLQTGAPTTAPGTPSASTSAALPTSSATSSPLPAGSGATSGQGGSGHQPGKADLTLTPSIAAKVSRTVIAILGKPQFLFGPLLVTVAFVFAQHRIDAGDPKLANAFRTRRELSVTFPAHYQRPGER